MRFLNRTTLLTFMFLTLTRCSGETATPPKGLRVERMHPLCGPVNAQTAVEITGQEFDPQTTVKFGPQPAQVQFVSGTRLVAQAPPGGPGAVAVMIHGSSGSRTLVPGYTRKEATTFDPNGDCRVDSVDVFYLRQYLDRKGARPILSGDATGDGVVDNRDVDALIAYLYANGPRPATITGSSDGK